MLKKIVATHRLKGLRDLRAVEKLAAWRSNGFDRCHVLDGQWIHSPLPPTPEETTANMWTDMNVSKKEISMSEKERSKQRVESFFNELEQGTASLTDEEFARLERIIMERRGRAAAHVVVAPVGRVAQKYRSMYMFMWREIPRARWTRSQKSLNHHRLVRVSSNHHRLVRVLRTAVSLELGDGTNQHC